MQMVAHNYRDVI